MHGLHTIHKEGQRFYNGAVTRVNIDSEEPDRLARFCGAGLCTEVTYSDDHNAMVEGNNIKIDLWLDNVDEATDSLWTIRASQPDFQPGARRWRVLLDPDGQPLCYSPRTMDSL